MVTWRWDTTALPHEVQHLAAVLSFCPYCYAVVPDPLVPEHRRAAHPDTITEPTS